MFEGLKKTGILALDSILNRQIDSIPSLIQRLRIFKQSLNQSINKINNLSEKDKRKYLEKKIVLKKLEDFEIGDGTLNELSDILAKVEKSEPYRREIATISDEVFFIPCLEIDFIEEPLLIDIKKNLELIGEIIVNYVNEDRVQSIRIKRFYEEFINNIRTKTIAALENEIGILINKIELLQTI